MYLYQHPDTWASTVLTAPVAVDVQLMSATHECRGSCEEDSRAVYGGRGRRVLVGDIYMHRWLLMPIVGRIAGRNQEMHPAAVALPKLESPQMAAYAAQHPSANADW